jgi:hypothetical protein
MEFPGTPSPLSTTSVCVVPLSSGPPPPGFLLLGVYGLFVPVVDADTSGVEVGSGHPEVMSV